VFFALSVVAMDETSFRKRLIDASLMVRVQRLTTPSCWVRRLWPCLPDQRGRAVLDVAASAHHGDEQNDDQNHHKSS
jgi:hypothetical protein